MSNIGKYCVYCKRIIEPCNKVEVELGEHDGYIYVHDAVEHPNEYIANETVN